MKNWLQQGGLFSSEFIQEPYSPDRKEIAEFQQSVIQGVNNFGETYIQPIVTHALLGTASWGVGKFLTLRPSIGLANKTAKAQRVKDGIRSRLGGWNTPEYSNILQQRYDKVNKIWENLDMWNRVKNAGIGFTGASVRQGVIKKSGEEPVWFEERKIY